MLEDPIMAFGTRFESSKLGIRPPCCSCAPNHVKSDPQFDPFFNLIRISLFRSDPSPLSVVTLHQRHTQPYLGRWPQSQQLSATGRGSSTPHFVEFLSRGLSLPLLASGCARVSAAGAIDLPFSLPLSPPVVVGGLG